MFEKFVETGRYPAAVKPADRPNPICSHSSRKISHLFEMMNVYFIVIFCGRLWAHEPLRGEIHLLSGADAPDLAQSRWRNRNIQQLSLTTKTDVSRVVQRSRPF